MEDGISIVVGSLVSSRPWPSSSWSSSLFRNDAALGRIVVKEGVKKGEGEKNEHKRLSGANQSSSRDVMGAKLVVATFCWGIREVDLGSCCQFAITTAQFAGIGSSTGGFVAFSLEFCPGGGESQPHASFVQL